MNFKIIADTERKYKLLWSSRPCLTTVHFCIEDIPNVTDDVIELVSKELETPVENLICVGSLREILLIDRPSELQHQADTDSNYSLYGKGFCLPDDKTGGVTILAQINVLGLVANETSNLAMPRIAEIKTLNTIAEMRLGHTDEESRRIIEALIPGGLNAIICALKSRVSDTGLAGLKGEETHPFSVHTTVELAANKTAASITVASGIVSVWFIVDLNSQGEPIAVTNKFLCFDNNQFEIAVTKNGDLDIEGLELFNHHIILIELATLLAQVDRVLGLK